jgi:hypothetical protein
VSNAYTYSILANGIDGVHSVAPHWVLTFVRWENRYLNISEDGMNTEQRQRFLATRRPLVVENDCASVSVSYSKSSHTPSMQAMLYAGDVNYLTAIAPGDFVLVNMLNFPKDARRVADNARSVQPINSFSDGFKGLFKVQSVRRVLTIDPATGTKRVMFQVSGFGFTEFNNTLYFNPFLLSQNEANNQFLFVTRISEVWEQYVSQKGTISVQNILRLLIDSTIGTGLNTDANTKKENLKLTQNVHFYIPQAVGRLLGLPKAKSAKDIYNYLFGIQTYTATSSKQTVGVGMNPKIASVENRFYMTDKQCQGATLLKPEYWNQVTVWSILNQYTNSPINELFVTLRVAPKGSVMPTVVFRQMPFSSEKYKGISTKFLNLPRWKVSPDLLLDINIGRDEAARINFVQVFGVVPNASQGSNTGYISQQIAAKNFQLDQLDIRRSGLKPYIITSNFDSVVSDKQGVLAPTWAKLLADALIGGQLKLNGSITSYGIVEPIAVGDNLELDGVVYHIEGVSHQCSLAPDGKRHFITSLELSNGVDIMSEKGRKVFGQMRNTNMQSEQKEDFQIFDGNLPGISDEQFIVGRPIDPSDDTTGNGSFRSYINDPITKPEPRKTPRVTGGDNKKKKGSGK